MIEDMDMGPETRHDIPDKTTLLVRDIDERFTFGRIDNCPLNTDEYAGIADALPKGSS